MKPLLAVLLLLVTSSLTAQPKTDPWLRQLVRQRASPFLQQVLDQPETFQYQVIYTRINRDAQNRPHFTNFYLNVDRRRYFNPASTVKLPTALLALEKINSLRKYGVNKFTTMLTDSSYSGQELVSWDSTSADGYPSVAHYIRKIFLVSDNDAYNRLYELVGQRTLNRRLWGMGYKDARITRRFVPLSADQNRHTNAIRFVRNKELLCRLPPAFNRDSFDFSRTDTIGKAHYNRNDSLVLAPMDFSTHNRLPLEDLQQILQAVLFPAATPLAKRFRLQQSDYRFLRQYMSQLPSESSNPTFDTTEFFDSYTKFFNWRADSSRIPGSMRSFNKAGWAYGFLTDAAYVVDLQQGVEFMVSAVIYVNKDGVLNDNKYEYEETGYPFFREIGDIIYQYELGRSRPVKPNLSAFRFNYSNDQEPRR
ncbi:MAG: serine hydrolase [Candidatus Pseudobacter hemicellulosilyticus]|uniref:Serine hydrolase n=1 Tax=Candidatus Pseudobacter hemicellulosilyticus TaxID=3121375 RepID=A0AAJ5WR95_9BACT|nr:MAG: serine hydrolase [Pseudobacter sp.]